LSELVAQGSVGTDTLIWRPGLELWAPASQLKPEILPSRPAPAVAQPASPTEASVAPPAAALPGAELNSSRKSNLKPIPKVDSAAAAQETSPNDVEENVSGGLFSKLFGRLKKK